MAKIITIPLAFLVLFGISAFGAHGQNTANEIIKLPNGNILLEDFEDYSPGTLPEDWYNQKGDGRPAFYGDEDQEEYKYRIIEEDGNQFLRYEGLDAKHLNFPLVNKDVNIHETPVLSWKWRVSELPDGANEDDDNRNDTAASIYVVFDMGRVALVKKVPKSIRYTWSSTLEEGKEMSKFYGNQKMVVVESGPERKGEWLTFERNIVEDYKRLFGDSPPENPLAILILSDGDNTQSRAKADYDDIILKSEN